MLTAGLLSEALVAQWLMGQGWEVLAQRWRCRWGELDLVVRLPAIASSSHHAHYASCNLAFVEVKARSSGNWDANGMLAITPQKQSKLWLAAQLFLVEHPDLADLPCRFDVALVRCQRLRAAASATTADLSAANETLLYSALTKVQTMRSVQLGQAIAIAGYRLSLQQYIPAAFSES